MLLSKRISLAQHFYVNSFAQCSIRLRVNVVIAISALNETYYCEESPKT